MVLKLYTLLSIFILQVFLAMIIVAVLALGITLFAFQTKIDFTAKSGCLFVALIVLMCFGFLTIFFYSRILQLVYSSLGKIIIDL